jgi:hypothetical protein
MAGVVSKGGSDDSELDVRGEYGCLVSTDLQDEIEASFMASIA